MSTKDDQSPLSRRQFLRVISAAVAGLAVAGVEAGAAPRPAQAFNYQPVDRFSRIFRLPPFAPPSLQVRAALLEIGKPGGILDAKDALALGPLALAINPALGLNIPNNPTHTAGTTFMGQFMDHDMTFDASSRLGQPTPPGATENVRSAAFDLDSVYGNGPRRDPELYDPADHVKFLVESGGQFEDLPRTGDLTAIIGDLRNDENLIIAGLHAAFLLFHNAAVDYVRGQGTTDPAAVFTEARRLTTWHYHWMIVHEFLPLFIGQPLTDRLLQYGRRFYRPQRHAEMPVEFQGAAYRFGHSMVRPSYRANLKGNGGGPFVAFIFDPSEIGESDPDDLTGGHRAPRRFIGWQSFFDFGDGSVTRNKRIDTHISTPLFNLPPSTVVGNADGILSLAQRNLLRHLTWALPSGQSIARVMEAPRLSRGDLSELAGYQCGLDEHTPLWYYVLKEAEVMEDGLHLGPVGGRIVGEVILGLLETDPRSWVCVKPDWRPTLPSSGGPGEFRMVDFLTFAGVDPASRGQ